MEKTLDVAPLTPYPIQSNPSIPPFESPGLFVNRNTEINEGTRDDDDDDDDMYNKYEPPKPI